MTVVVGQRIEIRLTTIGPGNYRSPDISSPAVRFWNVAWPKLQVPAGPTPVFIFEAAAEGTAVIRIPHSERDSFSITVRMRRQAGKNLPAQMTPDQANNLEWKGAWTNLLNDVRQTFTPSMRKLAAVEVNLAVLRRSEEPRPAREYPVCSDVTLSPLDLQLWCNHEPN